MFVGSSRMKAGSTPIWKGALTRKSQEARVAGVTAERRLHSAPFGTVIFSRYSLNKSNPVYLPKGVLMRLDFFPGSVTPPQGYDRSKLGTCEIPFQSRYPLFSHWQVHLSCVLYAWKQWKAYASRRFEVGLLKLPRAPACNDSTF